MARDADTTLNFSCYPHGRASRIGSYQSVGLTLALLQYHALVAKLAVMPLSLVVLFALVSHRGVTKMHAGVLGN